MKKAKQILLMAAVIAFALTACNSNDSGNTSTASSDSASAGKDTTTGTKYNPATPGAQNGQ